MICTFRLCWHRLVRYQAESPDHTHRYRGAQNIIVACSRDLVDATAGQRAMCRYRRAIGRNLRSR